MDNNILLVEDTTSDLNYNILSNIKFDLDLFTFIFVVYFLYVFLKDILRWRN